MRDVWIDVYMNNDFDQLKFDLHVHNEITAITENPCWTSISGKGSMRHEGDVLTWCKFLELWLIHDDRWQITALCYDELECKGAMTDNRPDIGSRWER